MNIAATDTEHSLPEKIVTPFKRLEKNLSFTGRFQWIFAVFGDSSLRQKIVEKLGLTTSQKVLSLAEIDNINAFENLLESSAKQATCLHLVDTRHWFARQNSNWPNLLNLHREAIAQKAPVNLVFWIDDDHLTLLARKAPDFWNWRSAVYEFLVGSVAGSIELPELLLQELEWLTPLSNSEEKRLDELRHHFIDKPARSAAHADLLLELARLEVRTNQIEKAEKAVSKAKSIYEKLEDKNGIAHCLILSGQVSSWLQKRTLAILHFTKADDLFIKTKNDSGQAFCHFRIADIFRQEHHYDEALEHLSDALSKFDYLTNIYWKGKTLLQIAAIEKKQSKFEDAKGHYLEGLRLLESAQAEQDKATALKELAEMEQELGNHRKAKEHFYEALEYSKKQDQFLTMELIIRAIGDFELEHGNIDSIDIALEETINYFEQCQQPLGLAHTYLGWASIRYKQKEVQEAKAFAEEARIIFNENQYPIGLTFSLHLVLLCHSILGDASKDQTDKLITQAIEAAEETNIPSVLKTIEGSIVVAKNNLSYRLPSKKLNN